jgi:large repetitive protein
MPIALITASKGITTTADRELPKVNLFVSKSSYSPGENAAIFVNATDNVAVDSLSLTVNGQNLLIDANGRANYNLPTLGNYNAVATARDKAGNIGQANLTFTANVADTIPPIANFIIKDGANTLIDGDTITRSVELVGTVTDANLRDYKIEVAPIDSSNFVTIATGTTAIANSKLGNLDPITFANDRYNVRLTATDNIGNTSIFEQTVSIEGNLKLGNFQLSFTDIEIPIAGIPISVTRTYDSLNSKQTDDFGYGWRLEFRDTDLKTSIGFDEQFAILGIPSKSFRDNTKVFITLPGGKREAYTFKPVRDPLVPGLPIVGGIDPNVYIPQFVSEKGSTNVLTVNNVRLQRKANTDGWLQFGAGTLYNPSLPDFGGKFILTTKEGVVYDIYSRTGDLNNVTNPNGNKLTFTDAGITSDTGQTVTFTRDAQGKITTVTDPTGKQVKYSYDAFGDLTAVTDRANNVTSMKYQELNRPHFLTEIIDPLGRSGIKNDYDEQGRLIEMIDALGKPVKITYDPTNSRQTVKDALGNPTTFVYDDRGNILQEIDPLTGLTLRTYDENNNLLTQKDALGRTMTMTYDGDRNKLTETNALGETMRYTYGALSRTLTETDALGNTTTNSYDSKGNLLNRKDALGNITNFIYDLRGQLVSTSDANNQNSSFSYDPSGRITSATDSLGNITSYTLYLRYGR